MLAHDYLFWILHWVFEFDTSAFEAGSLVVCFNDELKKNTQISFWVIWWERHVLCYIWYQPALTLSSNYNLDQIKIYSHVYHGLHLWHVKTLHRGLSSNSDSLRRNTTIVQLPCNQEEAVLRQEQNHLSPFSLVKAGGFEERETVGDLVELIWESEIRLFNSPCRIRSSRSVDAKK